MRDELRAIVGDVARLNNSIGALLDLSRLEAHAWEPRRELYELGDIVAAGIDTLPAHLRGRVTVDLADETSVVEVDFVQWTRVIQNLLENAFLYAGDGTVTIGALGWNDGVRLWVEDHGPGIPESEHEAVFEKFYRGRGSGGKAPSARGSASPSRARSCAATAARSTWRTRSPSGARFVIALSSGSDDPPQGGHMSIAERPTRILVVDDEEQIRRALRSILSSRGYVLEMAATGEEALLKAIDTPPDLVVLDLMLPDRSGIDVCRELRTWMTAPILILSVQGERSRQDPGARRGRGRLPHQAVLGR